MQNGFFSEFKKNFPLFTTPKSAMIVVIALLLVIVISGGIYLLATKTNVNGSKYNSPTSQLSPYFHVNLNPTAQAQPSDITPTEVPDGPDNAPSVPPTAIVSPTSSPTNTPASGSTVTPTPTPNTTPTPTPTSTPTPTP